ncbi:CpaE family protein [Devosia sp.]|uniref:AAA family ATPase n=1 Tax=Devosia sp. TaxID=1871048 RepID=UPI0027372F7D|nr:CpaE family protein [Devosia sp.]MDP2781513.1 CpaE family protein [Devosia sp.]
MSEVAYEVEDIESTETGEAAEPFVATLPRISIQAFCASGDVANAIQTMAKDRRVARAHVGVQTTGIDGAITYFETAPTPNLLLLELTDGAESMIGELARLADVCDPGTKVMVVGHVNDVLLYRELISRGVSEYLVAPITPMQVIQAVAGLYADPEAEPLGRILAFIGAKGGVGSSTVAHNTAWVIANGFATDAIIADFDLPFGTAALDFNQDPTMSVADAVYAPERLDDVLLERLLTKCTENLSLFAAPGNLNRDYDLDPNAYDRILDIVRAGVPTVVLDLPHQWSGWVKNILMSADEIVITAEPDLANLRNAKNLFELIKQGRPNDKPPHVVVNKVGMPKRPEISPKDFAEALHASPAAVIGFDPQLFGSAANNGQMIQEMAANAKPNEAFTEIAKLLTGRVEARRKRASILAPLMGKLTGKPGKTGKKS